MRLLMSKIFLESICTDAELDVGGIALEGAKYVRDEEKKKVEIGFLDNLEMKFDEGSEGIAICCDDDVGLSAMYTW